MMATTQEQLRELAKEFLEQFMSDISEHCYCAGWNSGLEYDLWLMVVGGCRDYGMRLITDEQVAKLKLLADQSGGWWVGREFMALPEWRKKFARWFVEQHLPTLRRHIPCLKEELGKGPSPVTQYHIDRDTKRLADEELLVDAILKDAEPEVP